MATKMVCIGTGPGPKNVLADVDGKLIVVTYHTWKTKLKGSMADNTYLSVVGFVQFEPRTREANGQDVRDFSVKPAGSNKLIRVTLWPEYADAPIEVGDFVAAEGKFTRSTFQDKDTGDSRESLQISANKLNVNGKRYDPADRDVAQKSSSDEEGDLF